MNIVANANVQNTDLCVLMISVATSRFSFPNARIQHCANISSEAGVYHHFSFKRTITCNKLKIVSRLKRFMIKMHLYSNK